MDNGHTLQSRDNSPSEEQYFTAWNGYNKDGTDNESLEETEENINDENWNRNALGRNAIRGNYAEDAEVTKSSSELSRKNVATHPPIEGASNKKNISQPDIVVIEPSLKAPSKELNPKGSVEIAKVIDASNKFFQDGNAKEFYDEIVHERNAV